MMDYSFQGQSLVHLHLSCGASTVNKQKTSGILQPWERGPVLGQSSFVLFCVGAVILTAFHLLIARKLWYLYTTNSEVISFTIHPILLLCKYKYSLD